ncbi:cold shock domain-containing protein [Halobacillus litoralis]|uniref:cold-shock protein n=1 Tax=Halobacillus litoralis TaxID=45668 RepID=UPI001CD56AD0|nr:cold shock domain-containing protein [Halobacillus litoralis]MCA0970771.1 cold shock domain-containing protein [Halobacillus litoralis]
MRQYGSIKWFGGFRRNDRGERIENHFGFIQRPDQEDLYIHKNDLLTSPETLREGIIVTFEIGENRGKEKAERLNILDDEEDKDVLTSVFFDPAPTFFESALAKLAPLLTKEKGAELAHEKLTQLKHHEVGVKRLMKRLPSEWVVHDKRLWSYLDPGEVFDEIIAVWDESTDWHEELATIAQEKLFTTKDFDRIPISLYEVEDIRRHFSPMLQIQGLLALIRKRRKPVTYKKIIRGLIREADNPLNMWKLLPTDLLKEEPFWPHAPKELMIPLLRDEHLTDEVISQCEGWVEEADGDVGKSMLVSRLPQSFQKNPSFFLYVPGPHQVELMWERLLLNPLDVWEELSYEGKAFAIYRHAKEHRQMDSINEIGRRESSKILKAMLLFLYAASESRAVGRNLFKRAHAYIQEDILDMAQDMSRDVNVSPLLPSCSERVVKHCEGVYWDATDYETNEKVTKIFCPRTKSECPAWSKVTRRGAILRADQTKDYRDWSLHELLSYSSVTPELPDLQDPSEYVNKLSGWVNRIREIRERLKCSGCKTYMTNNFTYAKELARYRSTVVNCSSSEKGPHDTNVYLNHCWGCNEVIDSRESPVRIDGYYICQGCGSGPQKHKTYRQGTRCPKCAGHDMQQTSSDGRTYQCQDCSHIIRIPPWFRLTGSSE